MPDPFEPLDCHVHTLLSPCARSNGADAHLATYVRRARELGWSRLCIADHIVEDGTLDWLPQFYRENSEPRLDETRRLAAEVGDGLDIRVGAEADMVDEQRMGASAGMAGRVAFLIMPTNHFHMREHVQPATDSPADVGRCLWSHMRAAAAKPWIDIIAHPFAVYRKDLPPAGAYLPTVAEAQWAEVFQLMIDNRIALEVNLPRVRDPEYRSAAAGLFGLAVDMGVRLSYGSDSHHVRDLGCFRSEVLPFVQDFGGREQMFVTHETFEAKRP